MSGSITTEQINCDRRLSALSAKDMVGRLSTLLPTQGPITEFVHHNTLHGFQDRSFHDAVRAAARIYGAYGAVGAESRERGLLTDGLRMRRAARTGFNVDEFVHPFMIRMSAAFFDQGLAAASLPWRAEGLFRAVQRLNDESFLPLTGISHRRVRPFLRMDASEALEAALAVLVPDRHLWPRYISEVLLGLKGWAGLCHVIETSPGLVDHGEKAALSDWVALFVICELSTFFSYFSGDAYVVCPADISDMNEPAPQKTSGSIGLDRQEWAAYSPILAQLQSAKPKSIEGKVSAQAIFCIDDREFSMRRFLETAAPDVQTFGAPGFFGLDVQLAEEHSERPVKLCPPPAKQSFTVSITHKPRGKRWMLDMVWASGPRTLLSGWLVTQLAGVPMGLQFIARILLPGRFARRRLEETDHTTADLHVFRDKVAVNAETMRNTLPGFTVEEAAGRVAGMLSTIGFTEGFAPIVAVIGHGASSTNNPYFAAYDCGACSGRPGTLNARAFCQLANNGEVRQQLSRRGIIIPDETVFIPMLHDTTADHFEIMETAGCTPTQQDALKRLKTGLREAAGQNALHRCRQFEGAKGIRSPRIAKRHVTERALALFEPRPEYNHATNIAAVVGPRWLTSELQTDRAIFLNSYDPTRDPNGEVIARILGAVIPVCGGINLEYFFSRLDPDVYGAGNKLPQNVVGCIGVMTGIESDLRTGLPLQMTEIHEPRRLMVFVLQKPDLVGSAILASEELTEWVEHEWIHLVVQDPVSGAQHRWKNMRWEPVPSLLTEKVSL